MRLDPRCSGPTASPPEDAPAQSLRGEALSNYVHAAAEELQGSLSRAEAVSQGWTNRELADALVDVAVTRCLARLEATGCVGEANRLPSSRLWNLLGDRLEQSWLVNRARKKPRGYAGDYELLEWICQRRIGDHPFGRTLDTFFQKQAAPEAVRARAELIAGNLVTQLVERSAGPVHAVIVGSGPAAEARRVAAILAVGQRRRLSFTLLDVDPAAIEFARERLAPLLPPENLAAHQVNLMRLPQLGVALPEADFLACPGLFDYLEDDAAQQMLALFWSRLKPGGRLWVGNFAPGHPTRSYMEWIGNWHLIYRTRDDLRRVAERAGIPPPASYVTSERMGIDLFLAAEKR